MKMQECFAQSCKCYVQSGKYTAQEINELR